MTISKSKLPVACFLFILCLAAYINTLANGFIWDDIPIIVENPAIRGLGLSNLKIFFFDRNAYNIAAGEVYRPLTLFSYAIDHAIFGLNPAGFHLTNIILHAINTILLFLITLTLAKDRFVAIVAAAIFAVHPIHTEAVSWIKDRDDLLSLVFMLLAFYIFVSTFNNKKDGDERSFTVMAWLSALFFYLLSLLSKEMAVTLPLLLILHDICFMPSALKKLRRWLFHASFFVVTILFVLLRTAVIDQVKQGGVYLGGGIIPTLYTMARGVAYYMKLLIAPVNLSADYITFPISMAPDMSVILSAILIALVLAVGFYCFRRASLVAFSIFFFFITLLPVSNLIPLKIPIAERFLYIPSIGFVILSGIALSKMRSFSSGASRAALAIVCIILIIFTAATIKRNRVWKDDLTFFTDIAEKHPDNITALINIGNIYFRKDDWKNAELYYLRAVESRPNSAATHASLASVYEKEGRLAEARNEYLLVLQITDSTLPVMLIIAPKEEMLHSLGRIYRKMGDNGSAAETQREALRLNPNHANARIELGVLYGIDNKYRMAVSEFQKALTVEPLNKEALLNLGYAYKVMGECAKAIKPLTILLRIDSTNINAQKHLKDCDG